MKPVTAATPSRPTSQRTEWSERSSRLFIEMRRPASAMIRRAFRGAFSPDEIEDIYAGAWVGVLRALAGRQAKLGDEEIRSYVFTAVAHQAGKELRRRRRKPTAPLELIGSVPDSGDGPEERAAGAEQSRITRDLLTSMPPRRRAVMLLRYGWGLDPRQVCGLVPGLSPRAYRKEITRGIDELTEKMRAFERGDWCAEREELLKTYAAGLADEEEQRQAKAHLSHCQDCNRFVAGLSKHLFDLGALAVPAAMHGLAPLDGTGGRVAELGDQIREAATTVSARAGQLQETAVSSAAGARGGGAAGAGVLAKLAGIGASGKLAIACVGGGVAASACIAAGIVPLGKPDPPRSQAASHPAVTGAAQGGDEVRSDPVPVAPAPEQADSTEPDTGGAVDEVVGARTDQPGSESADEPVVSDAPPSEQEFGVETAAVSAGGEPPTAPAGTQGTPTGSGSQVEQEFGGP